MTTTWTIMATSSPSTTLPTDAAARLACCRECPRRCGANRTAGQRGVCGASDQVEVGRIALHFWEEPPISGTDGSGTVFFGHCSLGCVYCQNGRLAAGEAGKPYAIDQLADGFLRLQGQGALNINMVTASHYGPQVREVLRRARKRGLHLPVVWNTSGYETVEAVRANEGAVDVYLVDFKYARAQTAHAFSAAADYPSVALAAIDAMVEAVGAPAFDSYHGQWRMVRGVLIRHLLLPGHEDESFEALRLLYGRFGDGVLYSLMNQYTPVICRRAAEGRGNAAEMLARYPELGRAADEGAYQRLLDFADSLGMYDYFWQEGQAADESFIPEFE